MRWLLVFLAWLVSAAVLGVVMFLAAIVLAGPHSSMLPSPIQPVVLLIAWAVFLIGPLIVARSLWRRTRLPTSLGVPAFEDWRELSDAERRKIQATWNTYSGEGRPLVEAVSADFQQTYGHLPGLKFHSPGVYHGGDWVIIVEHDPSFDSRALPVLHLGISVHQIVRGDVRP
jgi:hypothetical protein